MFRDLIRHRAFLPIPFYGIVAPLALFNRGAPWRGEWQWTIDAVLGSTVLIGPVLAAAAAWNVSDDRRRRDLYDSTSRGGLVPLRAAAGAWLVAVAALGVVLIMAISLTASVHHGGPFPAYVLLMVPLVLAFYAMTGAVLAVMWPRLIVAIGAGLLSFTLGLLGALGIGPNVLRQGPSTGSLAGLEWNPHVLFGQAVVLIGGILLLCVGASPPAKRAKWMTLVVPLAGSSVVVAGLVSLNISGDERFRHSAEIADACSRTRPSVCVAPSNRRALSGLASRMPAYAVPLQRVGAHVPDSYLQLLPSGALEQKAGIFALPAEANNPQLTPLWVARALTRPAPCPEWFSDGPQHESVYQVQNLLEAWILKESGERSFGLPRRAQLWLQLPPEQQATWVRDMFNELATCRLEALALPWT